MLAQSTHANGRAPLHVTHRGHVYKACLAEEDSTIYPFPNGGGPRKLADDLAHELGHAVVASSVGWKLTEINFPIIDHSREEPRSMGRARTRVLMDTDPESRLLVAVAGVVSEAYFANFDRRLANALRLFDTREAYRSDLQQAISACGESFGEKRFRSAVRVAKQILQPHLGRIRDHTIALIDKARADRPAMLTLDYEADFRHSFYL